MESSRAGTEIGESLESLLSLLLETLSRVSTNIYLPVRKSDKSLQLVLRLFQHGKTPRRQQAGEKQGALEQGECFVFISGNSANTNVYSNSRHLHFIIHSDETQSSTRYIFNYK